MSDVDINVNHEARASLAWPLLVDRAEQNSTVTYAELGTLIGGVHQRAIGRTLGPIQDYCLSEKLPPLTILVVQKAAGRPGGGFIAWDIDDIGTGLKQVYAHPWGTLLNPFSYASSSEITQASLAGRLLEDPTTAGDVYALVRVRGIAQRVFRAALLEAYDNACAFCGMTFTEALDAAHIVPWSRCTPAQRLDPRNGLLLCSSHHALFDLNCLTLDGQYRVIHNGDLYPPESYSRSDLWFTNRIHGRVIHLPRDERLHPDPRYILRRNQT